MELSKIINKKLFLKWILFPVLLFCFWSFFSILYVISSDFSPTVLSYNHSGEKQIEQKFKNNDMEWKGEFKAKDDYLGIVTIKFVNTDKPLFDELSFMIKEKGSLNWHEINNYDSRQFYFLTNYPFGFEPIINSKDRVYEFQIVSKTENKLYEGSFKNLSPIVITKYKYPKSLLLNDPVMLFNFVMKKIFYSLSIPEYQNILVIYSLPLVLYLNYISLWEIGILNDRKIIQFLNLSAIKLINNSLYFIRNKFVLFWLIFLSINIFTINHDTDILTAILMIFWLILIVKYRLKSESNFIIVFLLSILIPVFFLFGSDGTLKKISDWIFYFLLFGLVHGLIELRFQNEEQ